MTPGISTTHPHLTSAALTISSEQRLERVRHAIEISAPIHKLSATQLSFHIGEDDSLIVIQFRTAEEIPLGFPYLVNLLSQERVSLSTPTTEIAPTTYDNLEILLPGRYPAPWFRNSSIQSHALRALSGANLFHEDHALTASLQREILQLASGYFLPGLNLHHTGVGVELTLRNPISNFSEEWFGDFLKKLDSLSAKSPLIPIILRIQPDCIRVFDSALKDQLRTESRWFLQTENSSPDVVAINTLRAGWKLNDSQQATIASRFLAETGRPLLFSQSRGSVNVFGSNVHAIYPREGECRVLSEEVIKVSQALLRENLPPGLGPYEIIPDGNSISVVYGNTHLPIRYIQYVQSRLEGIPMMVYLIESDIPLDEITQEAALDIIKHSKPDSISVSQVRFHHEHLSSQATLRLYASPTHQEHTDPWIRELEQALKGTVTIEGISDLSPPFAQFCSKLTTCDAQKLCELTNVDGEIPLGAISAEAISSRFTPPISPLTWRDRFELLREVHPDGVISLRSDDLEERDWGVSHRQTSEGSVLSVHVLDLPAFFLHRGAIDHWIIDQLHRGSNYQELVCSEIIPSLTEGNTRIPTIVCDYWFNSNGELLSGSIPRRAYSNCSGSEHSLSSTKLIDALSKSKIPFSPSQKPLKIGDISSYAALLFNSTAKSLLQEVQLHFLGYRNEQPALSSEYINFFCFTNPLHRDALINLRQLGSIISNEPDHALTERELAQDLEELRAIRQISNRQRAQVSRVLDILPKLQPTNHNFGQQSATVEKIEHDGTILLRLENNDLAMLDPNYYIRHSGNTATCQLQSTTHPRQSSTFRVRQGDTFPVIPTRYSLLQQMLIAEFSTGVH